MNLITLTVRIYQNWNFFLDTEKDQNLIRPTESMHNLYWLINVFLSKTMYMYIYVGFVFRYVFFTVFCLLCFNKISMYIMTLHYIFSHVFIVTSSHLAKFDYCKMTRNAFYLIVSSNSQTAANSTNGCQYLAVYNTGAAKREATEENTN